MNKFGFLLSFCLLATSCGLKLSPDSNDSKPNSQNLVEDFTPFENADSTQSTLTLDNGMEVLIISNPSFAKASAALSVPVGSMSDPREHQGIAHFLEHLLFLGSQKYPVVGEYQNFVKTNGGSTNAYTSYDETNYQFEVSKEAYPETLDRFSRFFIDPLLDPNYIEKERNAVNSEFTKVYQVGNWRINHLIGQLAPPEHLFHTFRVGSNESLKTTGRNEVLGFYNKYYSANIMKLVLMGPQPRAVLEDLARKSFSEVPNKKLKAPDYSSAHSSLPLKELVTIRSLTPEKSLRLWFPVPFFDQHQQSKPNSVLEKLLSYDGKNSLIESLKNKAYVTDVEVDAGSISFESYVITEFKLTDKGTAHIPEIMAEYFAAVKSMKTNLRSSPVYSDLVQLQEIGFKYRALKEGADVAAKYASKMHEFPALKIDSITHLVKSQRFDLVESYLEKITPENMTIFYTSPHAITDSKDKYFGVEYSRYPIPESYLSLVGKQQGETIYSGPTANEYIARDFQLKSSSATEKPQLLVNDQRGKVWFLQEAREFNQPKAYVAYRILSPEFVKDARSMAISYLYYYMMTEKLAAWGTPITQAHNEFKLEHIDRGLGLMINGFSDISIKILEQVISRLQTTSFSEQDLSVAKEKLKTTLATKRKGEAYQQVSDRLNELLSELYTGPEIEAYLDGVKFDDVQNFSQKAFEQIRVESFFYGNLDPNQVVPTLDYAYKTLKASAVTAETAKTLENFTRKIPAGQESVYTFQGENNNNAFVKAYYTGPRTVKASILAQSMDMLMDAPYYKEMRTEKQYGYVVLSSFEMRAKESSFNFIIQSGTHSLTEIIRTSDEFISSHLTALKPQLEQALPIIKQNLGRTNSSNDINMQAAFARFSNYIFNRGENMNYKEDLLTEIKNLSVKDLVDYIDTYFLSPKKSTLSVIHVGEGMKALDLKDEKLIESIKDLKAH